MGRPDSTAEVVAGNSHITLREMTRL